MERNRIIGLAAALAAELAILNAVMPLPFAMASSPSMAEGRGFATWLLGPMFTASILDFTLVLAAGILIGASFAYLEYHLFKINLAQLGRVLLVLLPFLAIGAMVATLALRQYNLFLLSLYLDVPMIVVPVIYLVYTRVVAVKSRPAVVDKDRKRL